MEPTSLEAHVLSDLTDVQSKDSQTGERVKVAQPTAFSGPEHWSGQPFPSPGDLPDPGIEPRSPALQAESLPAEPPGKPKNTGVGSLSLLQQIFPTQNRTRVSCVAGGFFTN